MKSFILVEERAVTSKMDTSDVLEPVNIEDMNEQVRKEMVKRFIGNGFVIFEHNQDIPAHDVIQSLAKELNLGETYVTGYNANKFKEMFKGTRLNTIAKSEKSSHVVFDTSNAQGLHADATFEEIGRVPSTILYCEQDAFEGGDTILFDSVRAFRLLQNFNPEWAEAMTNSQALRRRSILGDDIEAIGPAFKILSDGEIISRFSLDTSSDWQYGFERVPYLREAFGFMMGLIPRGSGFSTILKLKSKQGILFANDKIAHGRTSFVDNSEKPRKMVRGLYLNRPSFE